MKAQYDDHLLESAWEEVEKTFASSGLANPEPGFVSRFEVRLQERKIEIERQQTRKVLYAYLFVTLMLITSMGYIFAENNSAPSDLLLIWTGFIGRIWAFVNMVLSILGSIGRVLPEMISLSGWLSIISIGGGFFALWVMMMKEYVNSPGVVK